VTTIAPSTATIDAALRAAAGLTGMEMVFLSGMTPETFTFLRVHGSGHPAITEGLTLPRTDSFCARMLEGAPALTSDAGTEAAYADTPFRSVGDIVSYIGVPVVTATAGVIGTLCAIDSRSVPLEHDALVVLRALADVIAHASDSTPSVRIRRTAQGWHVEPLEGSPQHVDDLTVGMALADLLTPDLVPPGRPARAPDALDERARLAVQVAQLEHALAARVVVEQAIGVLAERYGVGPREAFERLRRTSRSRGRKVHDLARAVVESSGTTGTDPARTALPAELR
jgi:hypothetical protein